VKALCVVEDGFAVGTVTLRDLADAKLGPHTRVEDVMNTAAVPAYDDFSVADVAAAIADEPRIRFVPVISEVTGKVVGVASRRSIFKAAGRTDLCRTERLAAAVQAHVAAALAAGESTTDTALFTILPEGSEALAGGVIDMPVCVRADGSLVGLVRDGSPETWATGSSGTTAHLSRPAVAAASARPLDRGERPGPAPAYEVDGPTRMPEPFRYTSPNNTRLLKSSRFHNTLSRFRGTA
jgi:hypothetical protein